jgi:8-oxo-dGTP pyrophosphatase MutT (NUDIX family)
MSEISWSTEPRFGDIRVKWQSPLSDPSLILDFIEQHIGEWRAKAAPSLWLRVEGSDLAHLPVFLEYGFIIHRVSRNNIIILNKILSPACHLPPGPHAYLGCGALCLNSEGQILSVRERHVSGPSPWKLPGGLFDPDQDETIAAGAIRECFEETGIKTECIGIGSQRLFKKSSMFHKIVVYWVVMLKPLTNEIKIDPIEIADCQWLDVDTFLGEAVPSTAEYVRMTLGSPLMKEDRVTNGSLQYNSK